MDDLSLFQEPATWEKLEALAGTETKVLHRLLGRLCKVVSVNWQKSRFHMLSKFLF